MPQKESDPEQYQPAKGKFPAVSFASKSWMLSNSSAIGFLLFFFLLLMAYIRNYLTRSCFCQAGLHRGACRWRAVGNKGIDLAVTDIPFLRLSRRYCPSDLARCRLCRLRRDRPPTILFEYTCSPQFVSFVHRLEEGSFPPELQQPEQFLCNCRIRLAAYRQQGSSSSVFGRQRGDLFLCVGEAVDLHV